jgi:hypothetical protein
VSFSKFNILKPYFHISFRKAKTKLPKEIKMKVDEWKFGAGVLMMCLVAYSDGDDVHSFQYVCLLILMT